MSLSIIIPVYKNEASISRLSDTLNLLHKKIDGGMEVVFVVDGSPDKSFAILKSQLDSLEFPAQLISHSRNFGSFAAIRTGLSAARGEYFGVMAADLQEPPELMLEFFNALKNDECDVTIGTRLGRNDPFLSKIVSRAFWSIYRRFVVNDMPEGGVDIFGCNKIFRKCLLELEESRSSLIALIFWLGFRRKFVSYERLQRQEGVSSWTFRKKIEYMSDSIFAFTDYPIKCLIRIGFFGSLLSILLGCLILLSHMLGKINVPGYVATMMGLLFFSMLNLLGLGLVGTYAWRAYENSKARPQAIISLVLRNDK